LSAQGIEGRIAVVGDDVLPGMYDRLLRRHTPQIEWHSDETLLLGPQSIKSARELEAYRTAGDMVTRALTAACESLLTGHSSAEAAAAAAAILMRAGGGFHRIDIHHGADTEHRVISGSIWLSHHAPGGRRHGARLDHGTHFPRLLDGSRPLVDLRQSADSTTRIAGRRRRGGGRRGGGHAPGHHAAAVGRSRRGAIARKHGYFDHPQLKVPLLGHGLGTNFIPYVIPIGEGEADTDGALRYDVPLEAGMVMAAEIFLTHPGYRDRRLRTKPHRHGRRPELLTRTPMLFG
jgi:Xaa-Pro dipeptidase